MTTRIFICIACRLTIILLVVAMTVSCATNSEIRLDKSVIVEMERNFVLSKGANKIEDYTRCYYSDSADEKLVHGTYLLSGTAGGVNTDNCEREVLILDGGCAAIKVLIDWDRKFVLSSRCNEDA